MQKQIVWNCDDCDAMNFTPSDADAPICAECHRVYGWDDGSFITNVSHEETLDDDGNFSADAWIPDLDDPDYDKYPDEGSESPFGNHVGFYLDVPGGEPVHVLGDPNMSAETADALRKVVEAAYKAIDDGTIVPDEDEKDDIPESKA